MPQTSQRNDRAPTREDVLEYVLDILGELTELTRTYGYTDVALELREIRARAELERNARM